MTDREKLSGWIANSRYQKVGNLHITTPSAEIADYLIAKGATIPVRCRECKEAEWDDESELYLCRYHGCDYNKGEHFCSYGERKEDDSIHL